MYPSTLSTLCLLILSILLSPLSLCLSLHLSSLPSSPPSAHTDQHRLQEYIEDCRLFIGGIKGEDDADWGDEKERDGRGRRYEEDQDEEGIGGGRTGGDAQASGESRGGTGELRKRVSADNPDSKIIVPAQDLDLQTLDQQSSRMIEHTEINTKIEMAKNSSISSRGKNLNRQQSMRLATKPTLKMKKVPRQIHSSLINRESTKHEGHSSRDVEFVEVRNMNIDRESRRSGKNKIMKFGGTDSSLRNIASALTIQRAVVENMRPAGPKISAKASLERKVSYKPQAAAEPDPGNDREKFNPYMNMIKYYLIFIGFLVLPAIFSIYTELQGTASIIKSFELNSQLADFPLKFSVLFEKYINVVQTTPATDLRASAVSALNSSLQQASSSLREYSRIDWINQKIGTFSTNLSDLMLTNACQSYIQPVEHQGKAA